jgi:hypothetical protein
LRRRLQGVVERAFKAEGLELALAHAADSRGLVDRNDILRPRLHGGADIGLLDGGLDDDERRHPRIRLPDFHDLAQRRVVVFGEEDDELGRVLLERLLQVFESAQSPAVNAMSRIAQGLVEERHIVAVLGQNDHED